VIVSTSRSWFNYRHAANALSVYHVLRANGLPDSNIILMLADDLPCNARNPSPAAVYTERNHLLNLYENVQVDYRGPEVNVENFLRVLTGRHPPGVPPSQTLPSTSESNVLLYMTGHGGDEFLKFQDSEEIAADDFAQAFEEMQRKGRYRELLFVVDTCQAGTLAYKLSEEVRSERRTRAPNASAERTRHAPIH
jgi:phosphatidylinositol glycan class K